MLPDIELTNLLVTDTPRVPLEDFLDELFTAYELARHDNVPGVEFLLFLTGSREHLRKFLKTPLGLMWFYEVFSKKDLPITPTALEKLELLFQTRLQEVQERIAAIEHSMKGAADATNP